MRKTLGRYKGTVKLERGCVTGFGTMIVTHDGIEIGLISGSRAAIREAYERMGAKHFDSSMVRRVVWFPREAAQLKRRTPKKGKKDD